MPGTETTTAGFPAQRLFFQDPTGCCVYSPSPAASPTLSTPPAPKHPQLYSPREPLPVQAGQCLRLRAPCQHTRLTRAPDTFRCEVLLRKEVIQPHLPVRLPCYDFVPIASPTFDGSLPLRG
jgi:hypothetical protein